MQTCPDDFFVLNWNKECVPLRPFLENKKAFQRATLFVLHAPAVDLRYMTPSTESITILFERCLRESTSVAVESVDPSFILWFWDLVLPQFGEPEQAWSTTTLLESSTATSVENQRLHALQAWKGLTTPQPFVAPVSKDNILFTCFEGHAIDYSFFYDYVTRVNDTLQALLNNQIQLPSRHWLPSLMCPHPSCCQYVTATFVTRKAVLLHLPPPPVADTTALLQIVRAAWCI